MLEEQIRLVLGGLLHDIGKVVYRAGDMQGTHAEAGRVYLKQVAEGMDEEILSCVRYHHAKDLKTADLAANAIAYIVYMADNIASAADRRDIAETEFAGFDRHLPLASVFNLLNGNNKKMSYAPEYTHLEKTINYPQEKEGRFTKEFYQNCLREITDHLRGIVWNQAYLNSTLDLLEGNLSYVPSSTNRSEVPDISLYDHMKLTAAFALCIQAYLKEQGEQDFRKALLQEGKEFYEKEAFLLAVLDISGVQSFIYTIRSEKALKNLRARSFYLEILTEHINDLLLERLQLSRANILYSGGARSTLLLPNTEQARKGFETVVKECNAWFLKHFGIALYVAGSYRPCSSNRLRNQPEGSYAKHYHDLEDGLTEQKMHRYHAREILQLNEEALADEMRECKVCRRAGAGNAEDICPICEGLQKMSARIMEDEIFAIVEDENAGYLPLPLGFRLLAGGAEDARTWHESYQKLRIYGKNKFFTGKDVVSRLWVGDYHTGKTFEELAASATGIRRLGILRADVDDLGNAFAGGFSAAAPDGRYDTLSRKAMLSRHLSIFFKLHLGKLLKKPEFTLTGEKKQVRQAAIVYSGGDDLFLVGAWDDVLEAALDLTDAFERYTEGTLTLSAGYGIYRAGYPISQMAKETALLEEMSKQRAGKNAVTLLADGAYHQEEGKTLSDGTYSWKDLRERVLAEKYHAIQAFFQANGDYGKNFLYHLLELIRDAQDKISIARYIYLLSRMEPKDSKNKTAMQHYREFAKKMLLWGRSPKDARELKTAIALYVYQTREEGDDDGYHKG